MYCFNLLAAATAPSIYNQQEQKCVCIYEMEEMMEDDDEDEDVLLLLFLLILEKLIRFFCCLIFNECKISGSGLLIIIKL